MATLYQTIITSLIGIGLFKCIERFMANRYPDRWYGQFFVSPHLPLHPSPHPLPPSPNISLHNSSSSPPPIPSRSPLRPSPPPTLPPLRPWLPGEPWRRRWSVYACLWRTKIKTDWTRGRSYRDKTIKSPGASDDGPNFRLFPPEDVHQRWARTSTQCWWLVAL